MARRNKSLSWFVNALVKSALAQTDERQKYRGGMRPSLWHGLLNKEYNFKKKK